VVADKERSDWTRRFSDYPCVISRTGSQIFTLVVFDGAFSRLRKELRRSPESGKRNDGDENPLPHAETLSNREEFAFCIFYFAICISLPVLCVLSRPKIRVHSCLRSLLFKISFASLRLSASAVRPCSPIVNRQSQIVNP
jgi:hypothetical protein